MSEEIYHNDPVIEHDEVNEQPEPSITTNETAVDPEFTGDTSAPAVDVAPETDNSAPVVEDSTDFLQETASEVVAEIPAESAVKDAYKPNYEYKVREETHKMDEWAQPFITSEESQKQFQDLYTRASGIELAKSERAEAVDRMEGYDRGLAVIDQHVQAHTANPGDATTGHASATKILESLGLPKDMMLQYALKELEYSQMPVEEQAAIDSQRQQTQHYANLEAQNQELTSMQNQSIQQNHVNTLDSTLAGAEVSQMAAAFNARTGRPDAFRDFVIERGIVHENSGRAPSIEEVVQESISLLGLSGQGIAPQGNAGTQAPPTLQSQRNKPVLPNISGQGATSPVKKVVRSLEDIRARHQELASRT